MINDKISEKRYVSFRNRYENDLETLMKGLCSSIVL